MVGGDRNMQSFKLLKFEWLSHVVARSSADVIVAVSVPFVSSTDCGFSHWVLASVGLHVFVHSNISSHVHDQSRGYPLNLSI